MSEENKEGLYLCNIENKLYGKKYKLLQMSRIFRARKECLSKEELYQHEHAFCELFFVTSGKGKILLVDKEIPIAVGDMIIVNASLPHVEIGEYDFSYYCLGLTSLHFPTTVESCKISLGEKWQEIRGWLDKMYEALSTDCEFGNELVAAYLQLLIVFLCSSSFWENQQVAFFTNKAQLEPLARSKTAVVEIVRSYIDANICEDITLEQLASLAFVSKQHLMRQFKEYMGYSPIQYQKRKKITLSFYNLMHRRDSIAKIASFVGFKSAYAYIKFFKDVTGYTPQEFRVKFANNVKAAEKIINRVSEIKTKR
jgi:AraC-like DNA-binding protein